MNPVVTTKSAQMYQDAIFPPASVLISREFGKISGRENECTCAFWKKLIDPDEPEGKRVEEDA